MESRRGVGQTGSPPNAAPSPLRPRNGTRPPGRRVRGTARPGRCGGERGRGGCRDRGVSPRPSLPQRGVGNDSRSSPLKGPRLREQRPPPGPFGPVGAGSLQAAPSTQTLLDSPAATRVPGGDGRRPRGGTLRAPRLSQGTSCCSVSVFVELWGALGRECIVKSVMRFLSFFFFKLGV